MDDDSQHLINLVETLKGIYVLLDVVLVSHVTLREPVSLLQLRNPWTSIDKDMPVLRCMIKINKFGYFAVYLKRLLSLQKQG